jgi:aliphatic sulfonates family ABC transporter substrate-binding protein
MIKKTLLLIALCTVFAAVFGCNKKEGGTDKPTAIRIGYFPGNTWSAQIPVAYRKGFFDEAFAGEDIKIEFFSFANGPAANEAFASGELDIVNGIGDQPIVAAIGNGIKITVLSSTSLQGSNIGIIAPNNSSIKNAADLKNKKIGIYIGTNAHKSLLGVLSDAEIAEKDVSLVNITTGSDGFAALARGDIDANVLGYGYLIAQAKKQGYDLIATFENYPATTFIVVRTEFLQANTELIRKLLSAAYRAQLWIEENKEESYEILGDFYGVGTEGARLTNQGAEIFLGITDKEYKYLNLTYEFLIKKGLLYSKIDDLDSHIDGSLINEIIKNYK